MATSSTEAEYIATKEVTKEAIWLQQLFDDLRHTQTEPTRLYEDNTGAIELARNPVHHNRTKHIDITYHFIREKIESGEVEMEHVSTHQQAADLLTKLLHQICSFFNDYTNRNSTTKFGFTCMRSHIYEKRFFIFI